MSNHLLSMFTGADNASVDLGRVMWAFSTLAFVGLQFVSVFWHLSFNGMEFAGALSTLAVSHGVSLKIKGETEPGAK